MYKRQLLYGTDGEKHVHGLHASLGVAQAGNPRMACVEHQVLGIVRFVNEEVVEMCIRDRFMVFVY